jgi:hypothetical protein
MASEDDEILGALGSGAIPALPLSSERYEFRTTCGSQWNEVTPPDADSGWHLVSMVPSFVRRMEWKLDPNLQQSFEKHSYEPEVVFLWAKRKS